MRSASYEENRSKTGVLQTSYEKNQGSERLSGGLRGNLMENAPTEYPGSDKFFWRTPTGLLEAS